MKELDRKSLPDWWPRKMVSGGQTGVDRAALEWAMRNGVEHGGWCPKGRRANDGAIPDVYRLQETESSGYRQRTKLNVRDSDATLILNVGELTGGTLLTARFAEQMKKPCLVVQIEDTNREVAARQIAAWLQQHPFEVLNVAGPGAERQPLIADAVLDVINRVHRLAQS